MNEIKNIPSLFGTTGVIGNNLGESLKPTPNFTSIDIAFDVMGGVYTAADYGVVITNDAVDENPGILEFKKYLYSSYLNYYKGKPDGKENYDALGAMFTKMLTKYNTSCWYKSSPYSVRPAKERRKKELRNILKEQEP